MTLTTSRVVAKFVSVISMVFASTDFLYLSHVQDCVRTLQASLTVQKIGLKKIPRERFAKELSAHPLANGSSSESTTARGLKDLLLVVSGLSHLDSIPHETVAHYQTAVEMRGEMGVAIFTDSATLSLPM